MLPNYLRFSNNPAQTLSVLIQEILPDKVAILVDENTKEHCLPLIEGEHDLIEISSGEQHKNLSTCDHIWDQMTKMGFSRNSLLVNLGGGVIGDMGGFAASTYKRGIKFVNFPTTLLSMVDASIGGKLGVDFQGLKNHIGIFQEPSSVIVSDIFLKTLPLDQLRSGFSEVLKHALIADDAYWKTVKNLDLDRKDWSGIIKHSIEIKSRVVNEDPLEKRQRKILNFGHSLGHAIETHFLETNAELLHGEAIAIGMILEADIAIQKGLIDLTTFEEIKQVLENYFEMPVLPSVDDIAHHLKQDKKNQGETLNFSLIDKIGNCQWDVPVSRNEIEISLKNYSAATQKD